MNKKLNNSADNNLIKEPLKQIQYLLKLLNF